MTWLSIHFYPLETPDIFLARALKPFLETFIWREKGARAFFVRFDDEKGPHIRLRLRGESEWLRKTLLPALEGWFADRGEWQEVPYVPEKERFGGDEALALAEEYFHISTRVVLGRIGRGAFTYGDAMFDAMRMHTITAYAAGFTRERAAWYFGQLCTQWLPLFFRPLDSAEPMSADMQAALIEQFEKSFDPQKEDLRMAIGELWKALEAEKFDPDQPEWLRWFRGNQLILHDLGDNMEKALPSLLHFSSNRLGVNNQDEVFLAYVLSKTL
jgi:thiopeptide-type bacteriocin biosynthesis protein